MESVKIKVVLGIKYYRSDLAAEMLFMHRNTLLNKIKMGLIVGKRMGHAIWVTEESMKKYMEAA